MTDDPKTILQQALALHQGGRLDEAAALYQQVLAATPDNGDALHLLGMVAQHKGDHARAADLIGKACAQEPGAAMYANNLAVSLIKLGRVTEAEAALTRATDLDASLAPAFFLLGTVRQHLGNLEGAATAFQAAASLAPDNLQAHLNLAMALRKLDRVEDALTAMDRLAALAPDLSAPHAVRAAIFGETANWREAIASYRRAIEREPDNPDLHVGLGDAELSANNWEEARAAYLTALEKDPRCIDAHVQFAQFLIHMVKFCSHVYRYEQTGANLALAEQHLNQAIRLAPRNALAHANLGAVHMLRGEWNRGEAACRKALSLEHDLIQAHHHLALILQYQGRLAEAEAACRALLRETPAVNSYSRKDVTRSIPHLVRWQGRLDANIVYTDEDIAAEAPEVPARAVIETATLPLAVLADHDFRLDMAIASLPGAGGGSPFPVLRDKPGLEQADNRGLALVAYPDGGFGLSLGDGEAWTRLDAAPLPGADWRGGCRLTLTRIGRHFHVESDGQTVLETALPETYAIPGDTLVVGTGQSDPTTLGVGLDGFSLRIRNYVRKPRPERRKLHILTVFYGDQFSRMVPATMFPSLMRPDGLPDLMRDHDIVHNIYCTRAEVPLLRRHFRALERLGIPYCLDTSILDGNPGWVRNNIYRAVVDQIEKGIEEDALVLMAPPDHVFGNGLADALRAMDPLDYLIVGHPRVDLGPSYAAFKAMFEGEGDGTDTPALVDFAMHRHPHHVTLTGLANPDEPWWNARREDERYLVRFKEPPPLAFYPSRDQINVMVGSPYAPPFETIDHDIVDLMHRQGRLKWVADSRDFFWVEYCKMTRNVPTIRNTYWSPAAQMFARTQLSWWLQPSRSS